MDTKTKKIVRIAMFTALAAVLTMFPHFPTATGYVHFGDSVIYIAAAFFGPLAGAIVGGVGHALADLMSGYRCIFQLHLLLKGNHGLCNGQLLYQHKFARVVWLLPR